MKGMGYSSQVGVPYAVRKHSAAVGSGWVPWGPGSFVASLGARWPGLGFGCSGEESLGSAQAAVVPDCGRGTDVPCCVRLGVG